jgi:hypothetical protein
LLISPIIFYGVPFDILLHIVLNKTHWNCGHQ